jgi:hypothetical protein
MVGAAWRDRKDPPWSWRLTALMMTAALPAAALAAPLLTAAIVPEALAAVPAAGAPDACASITPAIAGRAATHGPLGRSPSVASRPQLNARGELVGHSLNVVTSLGRSVSVALPSESFVGQLLGSVVVYTRTFATGGSQVRALNVESGCDVVLVTPPEAVRSALLDPGGSAVYFQSVTQVARQDMGVTRFDLGAGRSAGVMPPLPATVGIGPIFGTELHWSIDGKALAVESCGFQECVTRVLDTASGQVATYTDPPQGEFIALTADELITFAGCGGLPCPVIAIDRAAGDVKTLADEAWGAALGTGADGQPVLTIQTATGTEEVPL